MKLLISSGIVVAILLVGLTYTRFADQELINENEPEQLAAEVFEDLNGESFEELQVDVDSLDYKLSSYFGEINRTSPPEFNVSKYTDPQQYDALIELTILRGNAIDFGTDLDSFLEYGLSLLPDGVYQLDFNNYPEWFVLDSLLRQLTNEGTGNLISIELNRLGINSEDTQLLFDYIASIDFDKEINLMYLDYLETEHQLIREMDLDRTGYAREFIRTSDQASKIRSEGLRDWALSMMALLEEEKQTILIKYLLSSVTLVQFKSAPLEESIDWFIDELSTGSALSTMRSQLTNM